MRKNVLLWMIGVTLLFGAPSLTLAAVGTSGTTAGEKIVSGGDIGDPGITDMAGDLVVTYKIGVGDTKTTTCATATVTVGQIYGGKWGTLTADKNDLPGTMVDYEYQLVNLGNATDVFTLSCNATGLPASWTATILKNGATIGSLTVAEDAMATFTVRVTIHGEAIDDNKGVIVVTAETVNDGAAYRGG
ncbi:MAG: hypothetical protein ABH886_05300 [Candidatus Desantisbacteria bacterium]